ncbi:MAG TPA: polysaccharide biosynthesis tyrosine autokinase [Rhizomicrobium sp.]|nr:polysaccharide biosynthesis tyrosine autokinase [Rhizomicrobium sp.]
MDKIDSAAEHAAPGRQDGVQGNPERPLGAGPELSIAALLAILRRRLIPMVVTLIAIVAVGTIFTFSLTPRYTATSTVLFDSQSQSALDLGQLLNQQSGPPISISNQIQILTSSSFVGKVVDKLNLIADPEFGAGSGGFDILKSLESLVGLNAPVENGSKERERIATIARFTGRMAASVADGTSVITIQFASHDPAKAALIANTVADSYITDQLDAKFEATRIANAWLSERLGSLRKRVSEAETEVADYAAANHLQVLNDAGQTLQNQRLAQLNDELLKARTDFAEKQTRLNGVRAVLARGGSVEAIPELMNSAVFQGLRTQRAVLLQQQSQLSSTFGARHPEMIKLTEQIASINLQINGEIQRIISALQSDVSVSAAQLAVVEGGLKDAEGQSNTASQADVHLRELQRNADSAKSLYEAFLKRFNELGEQGTLQTTQARVIGRATVPTTPSYPRTPLFLMGSLAAGLFAAALIAFLLEQLDRGLRTREQIESELGLPMLTNLPLVDATELTWEGVKHTPSEIVVHKPLSAYNEAFRMLRAGIQLSNVDQEPKLVLVTSALPNEGKSTGVLSLARSSAQSGARVLLIDGDIRRPSIEKILGFGNEKGLGLVQCVRGEVQIHEAIIQDTITSLHILLPGASVSNPSDILSSAAMRNLLAAAARSYDLVLIDSSPILPVIDARLLARICDTTVFFIRWEDTPRDAAQEAVRLLQSFGAPIAGVALSMTDRKRQTRYGYYGDSYSYYGRYQNYYAS